MQQKLKISKQESYELLKAIRVNVWAHALASKEFVLAIVKEMANVLPTVLRFTVVV